jgi:hypothetical protein
MSNKVFTRNSDLFFVTRHTVKGFYLKRVINGSVRGNEKFIESLDGFTLVENIEVDIKVRVPREIKNRLEYERIIKLNKTRIYHLMTKSGQYSFSGVATDCLKTCMMIKGKNQYYNIEDFALNVGFKKPDEFYRALASYLRSAYKNRDKVIECIADRTLSNVLADYKKMWPQIIGIHPELDEVFKADYKVYINEFRVRVHGDMTEESTES